MIETRPPCISQNYLTPNALPTWKPELETPVVSWTGTRIAVTASDPMHARPAGQSHMIGDVTHNVTAICRCNRVCVYSIQRNKSVRVLQLAVSMIRGFVIAFFLCRLPRYKIRTKSTTSWTSVGVWYLLNCLLTYLLTYLFNYLFIYIFTYLLIYLLFTYLIIYFLIYLLTYWLTYLIISLLIYVLIYLLTYLFTYLLTCLFTYLFT